MEYNKTVKCDVCGKAIELPEGRIEWNYDDVGSAQICHHECSHGYVNDTKTLSDIILDQPLYLNNENFVYERLTQTLPEDCPKCSDEFQRIANKLFL